MKDRFSLILRKLVDLFLYGKKTRDTTMSNPYNPLSPTDEAQNMEHYFDSLNWALENPKRIKNIAIAGPMGSGKSSVIQSFQKRNKNRKYRFINISLATFKGAADREEPETGETLRLIELSILQQLFYFEKDEKIPDSRFRKIKKLTKISLLILALGSILFLVSLANLIYPFFLSKVFLFRMADSVWLWIHYVSLGIVILGSIYAFFHLFKMLRGLVISKLSFKNAEIEIDKDISSKSILNKYIDEILYFFEVTKYNVVVIEDLDRFHQAEVFTKLREINFLINNSKKITEDVRFIYAVRDDVFTNNDKTKFFDFVIPIIPVINSSNSREQLAKIIAHNNYKISDDLLDNISLFIDDMRLLYNIMNEYHLYSSNLDKNLVQDKLLSMMVYKNILPDDFSKLNNGEGILFDIFSRKQELIKEETAKKDNEIAQKKENLKQLEAINLRDIKELKTIYLAKIIEKVISSTQTPFLAFVINGARVNLDQAIGEGNFGHFLQNQPIQYLNQSGNRNTDIKFVDIEKEIDPVFTYSDRELLLRDKENNAIDSLKIEIERLEEQKNIIREYNLNDLFHSLPIDSLIKNDLHKKLIGILLREGYIDEDYSYYISIFYEGSLTRADFQFLINVRTQQTTDFSYELHKLGNLVKRIKPSEFDKEFVLNFSLVDFLLAGNQIEKEKRLLNQLMNQSESSIRFIDEFIDATRHIDVFIKSICEDWEAIWQFIENESIYSEEKKNKYFKLIVEYANVSDIEIIFSEHKNRIADNRVFLSLIENADKIKEIIGVLNIKFTDIDENSPKQLLDFIYEENHYVINARMLQVILAHHDSFEQESFETRNYTVLKSSHLQQLKDYIKNNIDEYISAVYLNLEHNVDEPLDSLTELLNDDKISLENKKKIINKTKTIISDVGEINDIQVVNLLLEEWKILQTWDNMLSIYRKNENALSDELISFFNIVDNAKVLSREKISTKKTDKETASRFIKNILLEEKIVDESYAFILQSIPYIYKSLDFSGLTYKKAELLVKKKILTTSMENFKMLKEHFEELHITLIENDPKAFTAAISSFGLDNKDILALLRSSSLHISYKEKAIKNFVTSVYVSDVQILGQIGRLILNYKSFSFDDETVIKAILTHSDMTSLQKIELFNKMNGLLDNNEIGEFLRLLGKPYSDIADYGKRPSLEKNNTNKCFAEILKSREYISKFKNDLLGGIRISTFKNPKNRDVLG